MARAGCKMLKNEFEVYPVPSAVHFRILPALLSLTEMPQGDKEVCFPREWIFFLSI